MKKPAKFKRVLAARPIVVEGADGSGRSTQIARLRQWLEGTGHATVQVGLKRSTLVSEELDQAQHGNILSHTTLSLFYATDFADQLENIILPSLKAGCMVLADRYIYTLMAATWSAARMVESSLYSPIWTVARLSGEPIRSIPPRASCR